MENTSAMKKENVVLLGAHMSIAGGIHRAVDRALSIGCTALQVFTKNSNQWHAKPLSEEDIQSYKTKITGASMAPVVSHDSYLINLSEINPDLLKKSRMIFIGLKHLAAFHVNDSKKGLGSHVDRHEQIGKGAIGVEGFSLLMNDARFEYISKILETPKSEDLHEDVENMKLLRSLLARDV
jgi:deoxyribonuclease-4